LVDHATLIVDGTVRDGAIHVRTIYKGACAPVIAFVSEPFQPSDHDAILFLRDGGAGQWQLELTGPDSRGMSPLEEPRVIAAIRATPTIDRSYDADLATFRAARGKPAAPANAPARDAAQRIFDHISWIGASTQLVTASLGPPDEVTPDHRWRYERHTGETGVIRRLRIEDDRVVAVDIVLTQ
jgi:hypothetical protein